MESQELKRRTSIQGGFQGRFSVVPGCLKRVTGGRCVSFEVSWGLRRSKSISRGFQRDSTSQRVSGAFLGAQRRFRGHLKVTRSCQGISRGTMTHEASGVVRRSWGLSTGLKELHGVFRGVSGRFQEVPLCFNRVRRVTGVFLAESEALQVVSGGSRRSVGCFILLKCSLNPCNSIALPLNTLKCLRQLQKKKH